MDDTYGQNDSAAPAVELMIALFFSAQMKRDTLCKLLLVFSNTSF